jgi:hypothetical protein
MGIDTIGDPGGAKKGVWVGSHFLYSVSIIFFSCNCLVEYPNPPQDHLSWDTKEYLSFRVVAAASCHDAANLMSATSNLQEGLILCW